MKKNKTFDDLIRESNAKKVMKARTKIIELNKKTMKKMQDLQEKKRKLQHKVAVAKTLSEQREELRRLKETLNELNGVKQARETVVRTAQKTGKLLKSIGKGTVKTAKVSGQVAMAMILGMNKLANTLEPPRRRTKRRTRVLYSKKRR